jgi:hypothetical protein
VKLADGTELSRGSASLEIRYNAAYPRATLTLRALGPSDTLNAALPLDVAAIAAVATEEVKLTLAASAVLRRSHGAELQATATPKRVSLKRSQESGKRARFHGRLLDEQDAISADFETELGITCLVPPEMLGIPENGRTEGHGTSLVLDEEFKSPFCAQFAGLL